MGVFVLVQENMTHHKRAREDAESSEDELRYDHSDDLYALLPPGYNPVYPYDPIRGRVGGAAPMPPFYDNWDFAEEPLGTLSIRCEDPLDKTLGGIGLKIGNGLRLSGSGALEVSSTGFDPNALDLTAPISYSPSTAKPTMVLNFTQPLALTDTNALTLYAGAGLRIGTDGSLAVQSGSGINVTNGSVVANLTATSPIYVDNGYQLRLRYGNGLYSNGGRLDCAVIDPVYINNQKLCVRYGDGLTLTSNALTVNAVDPITVTAAGVGLSVRSPLQIAGSDGKLQLSYGAGLTLDSGGVLIPRLENPLYFYNSGIGLRRGQGLVVENNAVGLKVDSSLHIASDNTLSVSDFTLWTGPNFSTNAMTNGTLNAWLFLQLTRLGGMVHGSVQLKGLSSSITFPENGVSITLEFDANGNLTSGIEQPWGFRKDNGVADTSPLSPLALMPDWTYYDKYEGFGSYSKCAAVRNSDNALVECSLTVRYNLNKASGQGFSLVFNWNSSFFNSGISMKTTMANFTYVANTAQIN